MMICPVSFVCLDTSICQSEIIYSSKIICGFNPQKPILSLSATATIFFKLTLSLQNITLSPCVNKIFSEKKLMAQAGIMPACKYNFISRNHAKPKTENPARFASFSISVRNRGKTRQNGIIIETRKSVLYIQRITQGDSCQQYQSRHSHYHRKHDCHTIRHNATRSRHTIPASHMIRHARRSDMIQRHTLHDPVTL